MHSTRAWAQRDPDYTLIAERDDAGAWRTCSYGAAVAAADSIASALLDRGLSSTRPLLVLSGNSINHLLMTLAAMTVGIPVVPVSVAYSLQSRDHARIRSIADLVRPGAVFAENSDQFSAALDAVGRVPAVVAIGSRAGADRLSELMSTSPDPAVQDAFEGVGPDHVAKILFTSGSTGLPKGVINTHRMLSANQQMMRQAWPFLVAGRPVIVDWLPWSHTFGGNHNLNMILTSGGTIHIDAGRPVPGLFAKTIANLADVPPTIYFNVPAGYSQLIPALEADEGFARRFFSRLSLIFNAAAALPASLRDRLAAIAASAADHPVPVTGSWGATETGPAVTTAHFDYSDARCIGAPLPGAEVKLVPAEDSYEIRVKGPMVTPGYFAQDQLTAAAFDEDGFYRSGDAVTPADTADANAGLLFRGRIAEDFKLDTGTFVRVGALRTALLSGIPLLSDAVIAGENRSFACALGWLNMTAAASQLGEQLETAGELATSAALAGYLSRGLADYNETASGSANRIERLAIMTLPADLDAGEITDKGYINQRTVLTRRADLVDALYADPPPTGVICAAAAHEPPA
jgi:feruloyl-CoA synthase